MDEYKVTGPHTRGPGRYYAVVELSGHEIATCSDRYDADGVCGALNERETPPYTSARVRQNNVSAITGRTRAAVDALPDSPTMPDTNVVHPVEALRDLAEQVAAATGNSVDHDSFGSAKAFLDEPFAAVTISGMPLGPEADARAAEALEGFAQRLRSGAQHVASGFVNHNRITLEFKFD